MVRTPARDVVACFLSDSTWKNHLANDHGPQPECSKSNCGHKATTPLEFALHYLSCSMVKCKKCDGFFDKDKDPELKAHMAESHSPKLIFGCVQCTRTFQSSDAVAQHYSAEHAFICAACPGTFFINSATRERHFATCGNTSETSDSGESFQTSRTEFSPLMQKKPLPVLKLCPSPAQAQVRIHEEPFSPAPLLPLTQSTQDPKIKRRNAVERLAQRILDEANTQSKLIYGSGKCNAFFSQVEEEEEL
ncbi:uncharacterized protein EAF02_008791 [Botrytis sinoallii]|uniref:uncharacterized protein n=1 Tax=Botrytis sinoallii TaxID=1463999 RepID=UPI00190057D6|nr:uncharacterized protein EAF02_008791 [Botrytis sinoallii]KAF7872720.1 hypothetical protein EAF02_008791 [Botrytis sinoallii]